MSTKQILYIHALPGFPEICDFKPKLTLIPAK